MYQFFKRILKWHTFADEIYAKLLFIFKDGSFAMGNRGEIRNRTKSLAPLKDMTHSEMITTSYLIYDSNAPHYLFHFDR